MTFYSIFIFHQCTKYQREIHGQTLTCLLDQLLMIYLFYLFFYQPKSLELHPHPTTTPMEIYTVPRLGNTDVDETLNKEINCE